jgi:hypothetical protein
LSHGIHAGVHFPGSKVPRYELTHLQERIPSLTVALQQATAHASNILRGKRPSVTADIGAPALVPVTNINPVPRTTAQEQLASLLKRQAELAEDPAREAEYFDTIAQIAAAQAAVSAEQRIASQEHA